MRSSLVLRAFSRVAGMFVAATCVVVVSAVAASAAPAPAVGSGAAANWGPVSAPTTAQMLKPIGGTRAVQTQAPLSFSQCPDHYLCMWWDANYSGDLWERSNYASGDHYAAQDKWFYVGYDNNGRIFNDQASSIYCYRPYSSCQIDKDWYPGNNSACLPPQWHASDLSGFIWPDGSGVNDTISSFMIQSIKGC